MFVRGRWQRVRQGFWVGCGVAILLVFVWSNDLFTQARLKLTDVYFVPADTSGEIVIVALDDASLTRYGRSPSQWARTVYADLIWHMEQAGARVVAFDLLFSEETDDDAVLAEAIQLARQSDIRLRTVMAAAGVHPTEQARNLEAFPQAIYFANTMRPTAQFLDVIDYVGYVNTFPDIDGSVRRQPSIIEIEEQPVLAWSLAVYLAYLRVPGSVMEQVITSGDGTLHIAQSRQLHIDDLGFWLQNYFGPPSNLKRQTFPVYSLVDVLTGAVDSHIFEDKIVLVGLINSIGITDQYNVPSASRGQLMSGVEIQANAVESLIQNHPLRHTNRLVQLVIIGLLSIGSSMVYMPLRWYIRLVVWLVLMAANVIAVFMVFAFADQIVSLLDSGLALTIPVILTTGVDITNEISRRRQSEFLLDSVAQVSQQRLVLQKILPHIAADIGRIVPSTRIIMWRCDPSEDKPLQTIYPPPGENGFIAPILSEFANRVRQSGEPLVQHTQVILPIAWQKRQIGILAVLSSDGAPISNNAFSLLQKLVEQLAPNLENALLYTEIMRQNALQDAILTGSPAGILVLDQDRRVNRANAVFDATFDVISDSYWGQPVSSLIAAIKLDEKDHQAVEKALGTGESFRHEIKVGKNTFNLDAAPQKQFRLWVLIFTDITHVIQLSELKTYIIRMLSHDLGNPLSRILGFSQLLNHDRDSLSEQHQQFLDYILQDGEQMDQIISNVLNLEHTRSDSYTFESVDMQRLVADQVKHHQPETTLKQQSLTTQIPDGPVMVRGNYRQLSQAIANLLSNAIKYTPDGGKIHVELSVIKDEYARVAVSDNGYGIPEESHSKIFTEFYRVKARGTADIRGTGLGLSLVKVVVDNHIGHVWFESEEGTGSTFYIELPLLKEEYVQT